MTYGFCPENWSVFEAELDRRTIMVGEIERVELRPEPSPRRVTVTLTLRSGRVESWSHPD